jgi:hypothetical protein
LESAAIWVMKNQLQTYFIPINILLHAFILFIIYRNYKDYKNYKYPKLKLMGWIIFQNIVKTILRATIQDYFLTAAYVVFI